MSVLNIVVFTAFLAMATAKTVDFQICKEGSNYLCEVNEVNISPCGGYYRNVVYKGINTTAKINITPHFDASKLVTTLYYTDGITDIPMEFWDNQVESSAGSAQTLELEKKIASWLVPETYKYKCKIWSVDNKSDFCCFEITVDIANSW